MSDAKMCDRCGAYFKPIGKPPVIARLDGWGDIHPHYKELCPKCDDSYKRWIEEPMIKAVDE